MVDCENELISSPQRVEDREAEAFEQKQLERMQAQHQALVERSRALFATVKGLPGVRDLDKWEELVRKADEAYKNGSFLMERMGANRYLDPELVAVLGNLREAVLSDISNPTAADYSQQT